MLLHLPSAVRWIALAAVAIVIAKCVWEALEAICVALLRRHDRRRRALAMRSAIDHGKPWWDASA